MKEKNLYFNGIEYTPIDLKELVLSECAYRNKFYLFYRINKVLKRLEINTVNGNIIMSFNELFKYFLYNGLLFNSDRCVIYFGNLGYTLNDLIRIGYNIENNYSDEVNGVLIDMVIRKRYVLYFYLDKGNCVYKKRVNKGFLNFYNKAM